jgi:uncharacterized tellurite resistance protein B-like protein
MFDALDKFLKRCVSTEIPSEKVSDDDALMIATAVLFLEMAYADFEISADEEEHLHETLSRFFNISKKDVLELVQVAKERRAERHDIWLFSKLVNEHFDRPEKKWILEQLWKMIYADGKVDKYEDNLIRKISTLIGLSHQEMIEAKIKSMK